MHKVSHTQSLSHTHTHTRKHDVWMSSWGWILIIQTLPHKKLLQIQKKPFNAGQNCGVVWVTSGKNIVSSTLPVNLGLVEIRIRSESESESGFIGQVRLHKQGIWLGKVTLSVLTQNIHYKYNTIQYKTNSATVQRSKKFKKVYTTVLYIYILLIQGGMAIYSSCATVGCLVVRRRGEFVSGVWGVCSDFSCSFPDSWNILK